MARDAYARTRACVLSIERRIEGITSEPPVARPLTSRRARRGDLAAERAAAAGRHDAAARAAAVLEAERVRTIERLEQVVRLHLVSCDRAQSRPRVRVRALGSAAPNDPRMRHLVVVVVTAVVRVVFFGWLRAGSG